MTQPAGEMPFLEHLEELRKRILLAVVGIIVAIGLGWFLTRHFDLLKVMERPIAPYLPDGKLVVLDVVAPFMNVMKFSIMIGLIMASPWVLFQLWMFLSPALTGREKRAILPSLFIGLVLFVAGAYTGWAFVLEPTVRWLHNFDNGTFSMMITYDSYLELVTHLLIAMGIAAELPLVMILLATLGVMTYKRYTSFRRFAVFLCFIGGAILSPAPEVVSMIMFTIPLVILYEVGVLGAYVVEKRRLKAAQAAALLGCLLLFMPHRMVAQVPQSAPGPPGVVDTSRRVTGQGVRSLDSSTSKRLGIPTGPSRIFAAPDSVMQKLLDLPGYSITKFLGDTATFQVQQQELFLRGHAASERDSSHLEADLIHYDATNCVGEASGLPREFQRGHAPLVGITMRFNTCHDERATIADAFTSMPQGGANWFIRGHLAVDSGGKRLFVQKGEFTSCDLPDPHYHFVVGQMKWVSEGVLAGRPAVLYIRDVPVAWLPFIFEDTKSGRRSGILTPHFGFNDIVRTNPQYNRTISNIGYYWAPNDYMDVSAWVDWYANRYTTYASSFDYNWLNRFVRGGITVSEQLGTDQKSFNFAWTHSQKFDAATSLNLSLQYQSNSSFVQSNSIDPISGTQDIHSSLSLQKLTRFGSLTIGGDRTQPLNAGQTTTHFPSLAISPNVVSLGAHSSWTPSLRFDNTFDETTPNVLVPVLSPFNSDSAPFKVSDRTTTMAIGSLFTFGSIQWNNAINYSDRQDNGRVIGPVVRVPNTATADPNDSVNVTTTRNGNFVTSLDYMTQINLWTLLPNTWKVTPSVSEANRTTGPLFLRSAATNGAWVSQGVKLAFGLTSVPDFFGFINRGVGPYARFRYEFAPSISLAYSPSATVSSAFAAASAAAGGAAITDIPATMQGAISLHQTFQAKLRATAKDTGATGLQRVNSAPKKTILSLSTSELRYDFEQAKLPGRTGWTTQVLTNSFQSDLLPGFQLSTTHDLWAGTAGSDTAKFSPFLSLMNASFAVSGRTFHFLSRIFGHGRDSVAANSSSNPAVSPLAAAQALSSTRSGVGTPPALPSRGFSGTFSYSLQRSRAPSGLLANSATTEPDNGFGDGTNNNGFGGLPIGTPTIFLPQAASSLSATLSFAPTPFWSVSYTSTYDFTHGQFAETQVQLQRDLHDWRASFSFTKGPTGNFALFFTVFLVNLPDIKFDYQQSTLQQTTAPQSTLQP